MPHKREGHSSMPRADLGLSRAADGEVGHGAVANATKLVATVQRWKLFWVTTPDRMEDCFVVAKNGRQAAAYECGSSGFETGSCTGEHIADVPDSFLAIAEKIAIEQGYTSGMSWPDYGRPWLLKRLGAVTQVRDGELGQYLNGRFFYSSYFESFDVQNSEVVSEIEHALSLVNKLSPGNWVFHGQSDATWRLQPGVDRSARPFQAAIVNGSASNARCWMRSRAEPYATYVPFRAASGSGSL